MQGNWEEDCCLFMENIDADATSFDSERPVIYTLEEIEQATNDFDETRRIGVGGYGTVYFGVLGEKVWIMEIPPTFFNGPPQC